jgi:hypothetical protein
VTVGRLPCATSASGTPACTSIAGYAPRPAGMAPRAFSIVRINSLSWSPVTESNRRPSPHHTGRHRLMASYPVGLLQARGTSVSG